MTWTAIVADIRTKELKHSFVFHGPNDRKKARATADGHKSVLVLSGWLCVVALVPGEHPVYFSHLEE